MKVVRFRGQDRPQALRVDLGRLPNQDHNPAVRLFGAQCLDQQVPLALATAHEGDLFLVAQFVEDRAGHAVGAHARDGQVVGGGSDGVRVTGYDHLGRGPIAGFLGGKQDLFKGFVADAGAVEGKGYGKFARRLWPRGQRILVSG